MEYRSKGHVITNTGGTLKSGTYLRNQIVPEEVAQTQPHLFAKSGGPSPVITTPPVQPAPQAASSAPPTPPTQPPSPPAPPPAAQEVESKGKKAAKSANQSPQSFGQSSDALAAGF